MKDSPPAITSLTAALRELIEPMVDERVAKVLAAIKKADDLLSTTEAAQYARVTSKTIRRWIDTGRLRERRAGRKLLVRRVELDELLRDGGRDHDVSPEAQADLDFR